MVEEAFTVGFHVPPRTLALAGLCGAVLWSTKLLYAEVEVDPTPDILATVEGLCAFRFLMPWRLEVEERVMSQPRPRMVIGTWYRVHGPGWSGFAALEVRPVCALEQEDDPVDPDHEHVSVSRRIRRGRSHEEHVIKLVLRVRWCNLAKAQAFFSAKTQTPIHEPGSIKTTKVMTKVATVHVSKQKAPWCTQTSWSGFARRRTLTWTWTLSHVTFVRPMMEPSKFVCPWADQSRFGWTCTARQRKQWSSKSSRCKSCAPNKDCTSASLTHEGVHCKTSKRCSRCWLPNRPAAARCRVWHKVLHESRHVYSA